MGEKAGLGREETGKRRGGGNVGEIGDSFNTAHAALKVVVFSNMTEIKLLVERGNLVRCSDGLLVR